MCTGTFGVPWDTVGSSAYNALMMYDKYMSSLYDSQKHLSVITFVNIDRDITENLMRMLNALFNNAPPKTPPAHTDVSASGRNERNDKGCSNYRAPMKAMGCSSDDSKNSAKLQLDQKTKCFFCGRRKPMIQRDDCKHPCCESCRRSPCIRCLPSKQSLTAEKSRADNSQMSEDGKKEIPVVAARPRRNSFSGSTDVASSNQGSSDHSSSVKSVKLPDDTESRKSKPLRRSASCTLHDRNAREKCAICMDDIKNPKTLSCKHTFCTDCINEAFKHVPKCPCCGQIFGALKGNQPDGGTMDVHYSTTDLNGFRGAGSIVIDYAIPPGLQNVGILALCSFTGVVFDVR